MHPRLVAATVLLFAAGLTAQTQFTAPDGFLNKTTGGHAGFPYAGWMHGSRTQHGDPSMPKRKAILTRLDYRSATSVTYDAAKGMGRRFSLASLTLGHTNCATFKATFSLNYKSAGTRVVRGTVTLPTLRGKPKQVWGNTGAYPFSTPFSYNGVDDLLFDLSFSNGTLANGSKEDGANYYCDGCLGAPAVRASIFFEPGSSTAPGSKYLPRKPGSGSTCSDSGQFSYTDFYSYLSATIYLDAYQVTSLRCKIQRGRAFYSGGRKKGAAISAMTVGGSDAGIPSSVFKCNRLHANMGFPVVLVSSTANQFGQHIMTAAQFPTTASYYDPKAAGIPLYWQTAQTDSKTGQILLSIATKIVLPKKPPSCPPGCAIYEYRRASGTKLGPFGPTRSLFVQYTERFTTK